MRKSVPATAGKIVMTSFHVSKSKTVETKKPCKIYMGPLVRKLLEVFPVFKLAS